MQPQDPSVLGFRTDPNMAKLSMSVLAIFLRKKVNMIFITTSKTHKKLMRRKFPYNILFTMLKRQKIIISK